LIDFGNDRQAVIDGGPSRDILAQVGSKMPYYDRKIEYMILTHPDADHLRGLKYLLENYQVEKFYWTGVNHGSQLYQDFRNLVKQKSVPTEIINYGEVINEDLADIEFIFPTQSIAGQDFSNLNNSSAVAVLDIDRIEILLTGDGEKELWHKIGTRLPEVEILKVSHHGAENGTSEVLLEKTNPEAAVISVGAGNTYGHPSESVLKLLDQYEINIYRTDQMGTIELISDGESYYFN
jgi:competence protein ComEC